MVRILLEEDEAVVGIEAAHIDRSSYEERHVELRPHHSPITLPPRLARAMVNLTGVPDEGRLWDPFAGTGGIALEAATIGAQTVASDNDPVMVEGTQAAFEHFGVEANAEAREGDFSKVADELGTVDAIATDPPYGRASKIGDEALGELYERFFACAERVLEPGGRLVAAFPDPSAIDTAPATFTLVEHHAWYVHASLTRHVLVLER